MADLEVENTLREIRERVLADAQRRAPAAGAELSAPAGADNGAAAANGHAVGADEALARMDAGLSTTARAWSRLPPILSYRQGAAARLELWLKRLIKRATHWFTWEQVNFNSAAHHALGDARTALSAHEHRLAAHERVMTGQGEALAAHEQRLAAGERNLTALGQTLALLRSDLLAAVRAEGEAASARSAELLSRLSDAEGRFEAEAAQLRREMAEGLERLAESQRAAAEGLRAEQQAEIRARAEELHAEVRSRVDGLLEEQRVCFKQLSLEAGEAAVVHDRARRQLEARLEALEKQ